MPLASVSWLTHSYCEGSTDGMVLGAGRNWYLLARMRAVWMSWALIQMGEGHI